MAMLKILQYPNPKLKRRGKKVAKIDDNIRKIIADMFETLYNSENCAALAACQLDLADPPHITVIDLSPDKTQPMCLVNGEIIAREGEMHEEEGCMSVPASTFEKVKRSHKIKVRALDQEGKPQEFEAEGYLAKCVQHELDHLDGRIFLDRLSSLKRKLVDKRITKWYRQHD